MKIEIEQRELISIIATITVKTADLTVKSLRLKSEKKRAQNKAMREYYGEIRRKLVEQLQNGAGA